MKIAFFSNYINHHQIGVADEFYRITNHEFVFVQTHPMYDFRKQLGYSDYSDRSYVLKTYDSEDNHMKAIQLALECDVMIHGSAPFEYLKNRVEAEKLTFSYSERWFKRGMRDKLSYLIHPNNRIRRNFNLASRNAPWYMLCASAYTSKDVNSVGLFIDRCYKWGYFTKTPDLNIEDLVGASFSSAERIASTLKILWVARFIKWKHPERMIQLALHLRSKNVVFSIDMIGTGELFDAIKQQVESNGLQNYVHLLGPMPNEAVLEQMREHQIFCFTSDRNEGWGAVLNEAMSNGCCPVAAKEIGSAPFLIKDGENGFLFKNKDVKSFCEKVVFLNTHPEKLITMRLSAYHTIHDIWTPVNAAHRFYSLAESMLNGKAEIFMDGPCSSAYPLDE